MKDHEFPALYRSADRQSMNFQSRFLRLLILHLSLLVVAAIISLVNPPNGTSAILQASVFLFALACSVYLLLARPDRLWYSSRAIAESVKTITWRFVSRAEPFDTGEQEARELFVVRVRLILAQNKDTAKQITLVDDGTQITESMTAQRQRTLANRLGDYVDARVSEQLSWYSRKSEFNRRRSLGFASLLVALNASGIVLALLRIRFTTAEFWPTDIVVVIAASVLAWTQAKRHSELAASYALAAHEISLLREQAAFIVTESGFSKFVGDAENAFSREHTQWIARRDN